MNNTVKTFRSLKEFQTFLNTTHFIPNGINRNVDGKNCKVIESSVLQNGIQRDINLVETQVFTGVKTLYIVDGQHLKTVLTNLDSKTKIEGALTVRINYSESISEIITLISTLNSTGKKWSLEDYATAYANAKNTNYSRLLELQKQTRVRLNALIECYSGCELSNPSFKAGNFKMKEDSHTENIQRIYEQAIGYGLPRNSGSFSALVRMYRMPIHKFDEEKFLVKVVLNAEALKFCKTRDTFIDYLSEK